MGIGEVATEFWCGELMMRDDLEELNVEGKVNLKWAFQDVGWVSMDLISLAQNRDRWQALVNAVMNFRIP